MKGVVLMLAASLVLGSEIWPQAAPPAPLAGFSFSPLTSEYAERDPSQDLKLLLDTTNPDLVRLPIYWEEVAPAPDRLDYNSVDRLLAVVTAHNQTSRTTTRVVLTIGARNFLYPELHEPLWAGPRRQPDLGQAQGGTAYRAYFDTSIRRYRSSPLLYAWQVENEPLDYVTNALTGADQIAPAQLAWEIDEVHLLDPQHEAMITTYDGMNVTIDMLQLWVPQLLARFGPDGHPAAALHTADALGLDLYVDGPNVALRRLTSIDLREEWKQQAIGFWADRARSQGKDLWLAEIQAQPWGDSSTFSPDDLIESAIDYRQEPVQVVLMWGVDTWLNDPDWLAAGNQAMDILRAGQSPL